MYTDTDAGAGTRSVCVEATVHTVYGVYSRYTVITSSDGLLGRVESPEQLGVVCGALWGGAGVS